MAEQKILSPFEIADALGKHRPTKEQAEIIALDMVPRLVVAGAGSGKTATMVDRVVWLVANGHVHADEVLGVTFTRKAAGELRERMRSGIETLRAKGLYSPSAGLDEGISTDPVVSTYHSYANTLVQNYGLRLGIEQDAQMLGQTQAWQLVAQLVEYYEEELPEKSMAKSSLIAAVLQLAGDCAEHLVTTDKVIEYCTQQYDVLRNLQKPGNGTSYKKVADNIQARLVIAKLAQRYMRLKKSMQVLDYGDLIAQAARIAATVPQAADGERSRFKVVLLDEFQDTSHAQMKLFSDLFGGTQRPIDDEPRPQHPVMAVGDPKQSIYGFRGASAGQLFSFYDYFPTQDRTPSFLSTAWRNDVAILEAANAVALPLAKQAPWVRASTEIRLPDLQPRPQAGAGQVLLGAYLTEDHEAEAIAQMIAQQRADYEENPHQMPTIAVLSRTRSGMEPLRKAFDAIGVPYQVVGLGGLLDTPEVVDLTSIMQVLSDPGRSDALMRIMTGARWRIGVADLLVLAEWARFLEKRREVLIREGIELDLSGIQEGLDLETLLSIAAQSAASADELVTQQSKNKKTARVIDEKTKAAARARWNQVKAAAEADIADSSSLIEAIENLPAEGWVSPASGRSFTATGYARLGRIAHELAYLREFMADDLGTLMYRIEETTLMDIEVAAKSAVNAQTARRHLDAFHEVAATYMASAPRINATLLAGRDGVTKSVDEGGQVRFSLNATSASATGVAGFLAWCEQAAQQEGGLSTEAEEPRRDAVQILTVHAAKGLEWDHVYVPALSDGKFPSITDDRWTQNPSSLPWPLRGDRNYLPSWQGEPGTFADFNESLQDFKEQSQEYFLAEERRLAYVAYTRARSLLVLTYARWLGSKGKPVQISPFLHELWPVPEHECAAADEQALGHLESQLSDVRALDLHIVHELDEPEVGEENPLQAAVTTALWPFDPLDGPVVKQWKSLQEVEDASARAALDGQQPDHGAPGAQSLAERLLVSRRARLERAAQNVFAGGLEGGLPQADETDTLEQEQFAAAQQQVDSWYEETDVLLSILNAPALPVRVDLPEHLSASQLVALSADPQRVVEQLRRPMPMRPTVAARQGTAFHSWVENYYGAQAVLDFEEDYADEAVEEFLNMQRLQDHFMGSRWAQQQPWAVEYPLETPVDGISVRGRVDAIFRTVDADGAEKFELVDWKSGRVPADKDLDHKLVQLAVYRLGFSRLLGVPLEDITAVFYYVAYDQKRSLDNAKYPDAAKLEKLIRRARKLG